MWSKQVADTVRWDKWAHRIRIMSSHPLRAFHCTQYARMAVLRINRTIHNIQNKSCNIGSRFRGNLKNDNPLPSFYIQKQHIFHPPLSAMFT